MTKSKAGPMRKAFGVETEALGDRQVRVVISTGQIDRSGDIVVQSGINVTNFKDSRTVLWNHDQNQPVASCTEIGMKNGRMEALVEFPDVGISAKADEICGLVKAGVINAVSIGFLPLEVEAADGKNPRKGLRIDESELLEFSFVSVPANPGAQVIQRAIKTGTAPAMSIKGLYAVASLAQLLAQLGYEVECSASEAAREGDDSEVPGQLKDALNQLGAALIAMTTEEVNELLADGEVVDAGYFMYALRGGITKDMQGAALKSGRKFSKATSKAIKGHLDTIAGAQSALAEAHGAMTKMFTEDDQNDPDNPEDDSETKRAKAHTKRALTTRLLALKRA